MAIAVAEGLCHLQQPIGGRPRQGGAERVQVVGLAEGSAGDLDVVEAGQPGLHRGAAPSAALSWNVRPMAMASPTDFIAWSAVGSAPGNFSKVNRGILVTT